jgi:hypothetical protein
MVLGRSHAKDNNPRMLGADDSKECSDDIHRSFMVM